MLSHCVRTEIDVEVEDRVSTDGHTFHSCMRILDREVVEREHAMKRLNDQLDLSEV